MKKSYYIVIGMIVLFGAVFWHFKSDKTPMVKNYPSNGTDIVAFGDSLVEGVGASYADKNFVSLLSARIGQPIINLGVSGNTTADGLARLSELDKYNPKVVLLLLGGNDRLKQIPKETTFSNLGQIIQNLQSRGAIVLLLGIRGSLIGDKFEPGFGKLHNQYQTAYVSDVLNGLFGNAQVMSDTVHPNDLGYTKIADRVYPVLAQLIK